MSQTIARMKVPISSQTDIVVATQKGRMLAQQYGFSIIDQFITATVISEIAHNIVDYAKGGEITLNIIEDELRQGIVVVASDAGPGIPDLDLALKDGYSTGSGLGLGLSGAKRLMDEFEIISEVGKGTKVTMRKWKV